MNHTHFYILYKLSFNFITHKIIHKYEKTLYFLNLSILLHNTVDYNKLQMAKINNNNKPNHHQKNKNHKRNNAHPPKEQVIDLKCHTIQ